MVKSVRTYFLILLSVILLSSCSKYQKLLKSGDLEKKYEGAVQYYNDKDYVRALPLLEELVTQFKATKRSESVYYYYAYTQYALGDYTMASYHFENFVKSFPNSEHAEECQYMNAYCYYLDSPIYSLDQTNTERAISELQFFTNKYPQSKRVEDCNKLIDLLRAKLDTKYFETAKLYYNTQNYKAAVTSLKNVIKESSNPKYQEEAMFLIIKSHYLYANNSIEEKKLERYKAAVSSYQPFVDKFPSSKFLKEAESIYSNSQKQVTKLTSPNTQL